MILTRRQKRRLNGFVVVAAAATLTACLLLSSTETLAQCAMCKMSAASAGASAQRALGTGALVLLIPPVAIFCSLFFVIYRQRGGSVEEK